MNFISQVRALPNPAAGQSQPLTLHLSPTSTASIMVQTLTPAAPSSQPFVKLAPDAEVIVAPKPRGGARPASSRDTRSVNSTGKRSVGGRSERSTGRHRSAADEQRARPPLFLRGVCRSLDSEWFAIDDDTTGVKSFLDEGLKVWLDREHLSSQTLRGVSWARVSIVKPAGLQETQGPQAQPVSDALPATRVVAKLCAWDDAPDSRHVVLSSLLCDVLGSSLLVGGVVRIEPAPAPLPRTASALKDASQLSSKDALVKRLRITPFAGTAPVAGLKFGGESKAEREKGMARFQKLFEKGLLSGPLTEGMLLPAKDDWPGGVLDFDPTPAGDPSKARLNWLQGGDPVSYTHLTLPTKRIV